MKKSTLRWKGENESVEVHAKTILYALKHHHDIELRTGDYQICNVGSAPEYDPEDMRDIEVTLHMPISSRIAVSGLTKIIKEIEKRGLPDSSFIAMRCEVQPKLSCRQLIDLARAYVDILPVAQRGPLADDLENYEAMIAFGDRNSSSKAARALMSMCLRLHKRTMRNFGKYLFDR